MYQRYIAAMGKAESANEVTTAMNSLSDKLDVITPEMRKLQNKDPEVRKAQERMSRAIMKE